MKKQLIKLIICVVFFTANPVFCMDPSQEDEVPHFYRLPKDQLMVVIQELDDSKATPRLFQLSYSFTRFLRSHMNKMDLTLVGHGLSEANFSLRYKQAYISSLYTTPLQFHSLGRCSSSKCLADQTCVSIKEISLFPYAGQLQFFVKVDSNDPSALFLKPEQGFYLVNSHPDRHIDRIEIDPQAKYQIFVQHEQIFGGYIKLNFLLYKNGRNSHFTPSSINF